MPTGFRCLFYILNKKVLLIHTIILLKLRVPVTVFLLYIDTGYSELEQFDRVDPQSE